MFVDIMNIKESGWWQWGKNFGVKGKGVKYNGSLCCCSKEGWYHSWQKHTVNSENVQCC